jgi:hypothetical protein
MMATRTEDASILATTISPEITARPHNRKELRKNPQFGELSTKP